MLSKIPHCIRTYFIKHLKCTFSYKVLFLMIFLMCCVFVILDDIFPQISVKFSSYSLSLVSGKALILK